MKKRENAPSGQKKIGDTLFINIVDGIIILWLSVRYNGEISAN